MTITAKNLIEAIQQELSTLLTLAKSPTPENLEHIHSHGEQLNGLMTQLRSLPRAEIMPFQETLVGIMASINTLQETLVKQRDHTKDALKEINLRNKQQHSYGDK